MKLESLHIFPLKSAQGIELDTVRVKTYGFEDDRSFSIINPQNEVVTARENTAILKLQIQKRKNTFEILFDGDSISFNKETHGEKVDISLFRKTAIGVLIHGELDNWLSDKLGIQCRVVKIDTLQLRKTENTEITFSDVYPVHLINKASVLALNEKLETPVEVNRYRANIIVSGLQAFQENQIKRLQIGACNFRVVTKTQRCSLITIDPNTGEKGKEPLRTLAKEFLSGDKIAFGIYLIPENEGAIRLTDDILFS